MEPLESRRLFSAAGFGVDGVGEAWFGSSGAVPMDSAIGADGKITIVGEKFGPTPVDNSKNPSISWSVARFNADGSPDRTFGASGEGTIVLPLSYESVADHVLVQPDGRIIVTGTRDDHFEMDRFNVDGSVDGSFNAGVASSIGFELPLGSEFAWLGDAWQTSEGKIVLTGLGTYLEPTAHFNPSSDEPSIADERRIGLLTVRLNNDGTFDSSFGTDGSVMTPLGIASPFDVYFRDAELLHDGSIVAYADDWTQATGPEGSPQLLRIELDSNGQLRSATHIAPLMPTMEPESGGGYGGSDYDVNVASDGSAYVASGMHDPRIERINAAGAIDPSFGTNGLMTTPMDFIVSLTATPEGKLLVQGGRARPNDQGYELYDTLLIRLNSDGSADPTFNSGQPILNDSFVWGSLTDPLLDGSTFLVTGLGPYGSAAFAVKKLLADGRIAPSANPQIPDQTYGFDDLGGEDSLPEDAGDPPVTNQESGATDGLSDLVEVVAEESDFGFPFALTPNFFDGDQSATLLDTSGSGEFFDYDLI